MWKFSIPKQRGLFIEEDHTRHILGDPGADSGGEGKSKQAGKYGTREK